MRSHLYIYSLNQNDFDEQFHLIDRSYSHSLERLDESLDVKKLGLGPTDDCLAKKRLVKVRFKKGKKGFDLRSYLYEHGFSLNGIHYVRYKRTASSARNGSCLFIDESRFAEMMEWSKCGLREKPVDAKYEAYLALTLSGCIGFFSKPLKNILVLPDDVSEFRIGQGCIVSSAKKGDRESDSCVIVGDTKAERFSDADMERKISNKIWDGQSLIEESVFLDVAPAADKSMLLLRSRFFKSCAFRTRLTQWFHDHGLWGEIKPGSLRGYTQAKNYEDIWLVTTYSSLKFLRFYDEAEYMDAISQWMSLSDDIENFGIVKTDKKSSFFDGQLVQTNYQLLNTIFLDEKTTEVFLKPTLELIDRMIEDPVLALKFAKMTRRSDDSEEESEEGESNNGDDEEYFNPLETAILKLAEINKNFLDTKAGRDFVRRYVEGMKRRLLKGRILIHGVYATLFGNPVEMLAATCANSPKSLSSPSIRYPVDKVHCSFFKEGTMVIGERSPHILMGNILCAWNKDLDWNERQYFPLNENIVCVSSIQSDLPERLNGADFDSDTMLLTDDKILCDALGNNNSSWAFRYQNKFGVPHNFIELPSAEKPFSTIAEMDNGIADNMLGQIVDLSQNYNSLFWDTVYHKNRRVFSIGDQKFEIRDGEGNPPLVFEWDSEHNAAKILNPSPGKSVTIEINHDGHWIIDGEDSGDMAYLPDSSEKLYLKNCILEVLSNIVVDSAKGNTSIEPGSIMKALEKEVEEQPKSLLVAARKTPEIDHLSKFLRDSPCQSFFLEDRESGKRILVEKVFSSRVFYSGENVDFLDMRKSVRLDSREFYPEKGEVVSLKEIILLCNVTKNGNFRNLVGAISPYENGADRIYTVGEVLDIDPIPKDKIFVKGIVSEKKPSIPYKQYSSTMDNIIAHVCAHQFKPYPVTPALSVSSLLKYKSTNSSHDQEVEEFYKKIRMLSGVLSISADAKQYRQLNKTQVAALLELSKMEKGDLKKKDPAFFNAVIKDQRTSARRKLDDFGKECTSGCFSDIDILARILMKMGTDDQEIVLYLLSQYAPKLRKVISSDPIEPPETDPKHYFRY